MRPKRQGGQPPGKKKEPEVVHRLYEFGHARHLVQKARKTRASAATSPWTLAGTAA